MYRYVKNKWHSKGSVSGNKLQRGRASQCFPVIRSDWPLLSAAEGPSCLVTVSRKCFAGTLLSGGRVKSEAKEMREKVFLCLACEVLEVRSCQIVASLNTEAFASLCIPLRQVKSSLRKKQQWQNCPTTGRIYHQRECAAAWGWWGGDKKPFRWTSSSSDNRPRVTSPVGFYLLHSVTSQRKK